MSKDFTIKKITIYRNTTKYVQKPHSGMWLSITSGGFLYVSLPKSRYYFRLRRPDGSYNKNVRNVVIDDSTQTIQVTYYLPKSAINNEFGRSVTSKFKFVFDRPIDYLKTKNIFLDVLGKKAKIKKVSRRIKQRKTRSRKKTRSKK